MDPGPLCTEVPRKVRWLALQEEGEDVEVYAAQAEHVGRHFCFRQRDWACYCCMCVGCGGCDVIGVEGGYAAQGGGIGPGRG